MALPFFYISNYDDRQKQIVLNEDTFKHVIQVLRMKEGEKLNLTDGKGSLLTCSIVDENKKHCTVEVREKKINTQAKRKVSVAISLLKNSNRFEWFLEKATEIGVSEIIPLICERTEKTTFKFDRLKNILVSAMLQSQQTWLPVLHEPLQYAKLWESCKLLPKLAEYQQKFIAHCMDGDKRNLTDIVNKSLFSKIILIGPEGDFTPGEIDLALQNNFSAVALGETRLRTETAGIVAAVLLSQY